MRKLLVLGTLLAAAAAFVGCIETKQDFTLNPDGSGKVVVDLLMQDMAAMFGGPDQPDPELTLKQAVRGILDRTAGLDAWSDVTFDRAADGRIHFHGTAYFKDFSKFTLSAGKFQSVSWAKDDQGGMTLKVENNQNQDKKPEGATPPAPMTDEQVNERMQTERAKFQQMRPMMEMMLGKVRIDLTFWLPGTVAEVNNLQKGANGSVRMVLEGARMLQVMDELVADDNFLRETIKAGGQIGAGGGRMGQAANEKMFGSKGPIKVRVNGDLKPLFNYDAEVTPAKAAYPGVLEKLGLNNLPPAKAPQFGAGAMRGMMGAPPAPGGAPVPPSAPQP